MKTLYRRSISICAGVLALTLSLATNAVPAQAAAAILVDDDHVECPTAAYTTIQAAVAAAGSSARTITICTGIYYGPVVIDGAHNLKLIGREGAALIPPPGLFANNMISVSNSTGVTIQNLFIDGDGRLASPAGVTYEVAINFWFSSGKIIDNSILGWHTPGFVSAGSAQIIGISAGDNLNRKVTISNNYIKSFQGIGIQVREKTKATLTGNTLLAGPALSADMLIGMAVWSGYYGQPTGTISKNLVAYGSSPAPTTTYGMYMANVSKWTVTKNEVEGWYYGMRLSSECPYDGQADSLKVTKNTLTETTWAIWLRAAPSGSCGSDPAHMNKPQVVGNKITNTSALGGYGVLIQAFGPNPPVGQVVNAKVTGNTITHFLVPVFQVAGAGGTITGTFAPNTSLP